MGNKVDRVVRGVHLSWRTWGQMRGHELGTGEVGYVKALGETGFERIFSIHIEGADIDYKVQQMISYIKAGLLPDTILLLPDTAPSNLGEILSQKGFALREPKPCMLLALEDFEAAKQAPGGFEILLVDDESRLVQWLSVTNEALFEKELVSLAQLKDVLALENTAFYLGVAGGKPVSACLTITQGDAAVLELVSTLGEYRRQGFATALVNKALLDLKNRGMKTVSLTAEAPGVPLYEKLGFETPCHLVLAVCDWENIYHRACPCKIEDEKVARAKAIFDATADIQGFVVEMGRQKVVGREIWYQPEENAIYITKMYACDCGGGCPDNDSLIGRRCHCVYINGLKGPLPMSYCKCAAGFFEPLFQPLFGEAIVIEPVETVVAGGKECIFRVRL